VRRRAFGLALFAIKDNKQVSLYDFKGQRVRVMELEGNPWFVAADVCRCLELRYHPSNGYSHHLRHLNADQVTPGIRYRGKAKSKVRPTPTCF